MPDIGDVLGNYQLGEVLGSGGMGTVHRAAHVLLGRPVAVKVLSDKLAEDSDFVSRFFSEARIVNDIRHPNIIDIIDFVSTSEPKCVAYVMELLDGRPLSTILEEGPLSPVQAANAGIQLASALEAVHSVKVVHRDLKPDNLFILGPPGSDLSAEPSLKILDFGVAKISEPGISHRTKTGMVVGTPAYMAPEQIASDEITGAADVYAFGEILYEMLTGQRLFNGTPAVVFKSKLLGELPPIELPNFPNRLELKQLIEQCLVNTPADRPRLDEVRECLLGIRDGTPVRGRTREVPFKMPGAPEPRGRSFSNGRPPTNTVSLRPGEGGAVAAAAAPELLAPPPAMTAPAQAGPVSYSRAPRLERHSYPRPIAPESARAGARRILIPLATMTVTLGILVAAWLLLERPEAESAPPPAAPAPLPGGPSAGTAAVIPVVTAPPIPDPATVTPPPSSPPSQPAATTRREATATTFMVTVASKPTGAEVFDTQTKARLGTTPVSVEVPQGRTRSVELRAAGQEPQVVTLEPSRPNITVALVPHHPGGRRLARSDGSPEHPTRSGAEPTRPAHDRTPLRKDEVTPW